MIQNKGKRIGNKRDDRLILQIPAVVPRTIVISSDNEETSLILDNDAMQDNRVHNTQQSGPEDNVDENGINVETTDQTLKDIEFASTVWPQANLHDGHKVNLSHFERIKVLGKGGFGVVFLVRKKGGTDDGQLYAMKVLQKSTQTRTVMRATCTKRERQVLEAVREIPFMVSLHYAFQTDSRLYFVLDYVNGGDLHGHLLKRKYFKECEVRIYMAEIVVAIEQLHKRGIMYRDIKMENILLDSDGHIVITDFGMAKQTGKETRGKSYSYCGTIDYMAPEMVKTGKSGHNASVDWWSVGVLCYELLSGQLPFTSTESTDTEYRILKEASFSHESIHGASEDLITKLLNKKPNQRLGSGPRGVAEIKEHAFFSGIDWNEVLKKEIDAPFKPKIVHPLDTSNFGEEFNGMSVDNEPCDAPSNHQKLFRGFSYVASIHFDPDLDRKPTIKEVIDLGKNKDEFFDRYKFASDKPIGTGTHSICMKCIEKSTNCELAVKILRSNRDVMAEIDALKTCKGHPNIVNFVEVIKGRTFIYIVTELLNGEEVFMYAEDKKLEESSVRRVFKDIVSAVSHMHTNNIAHRDLKLENMKFATKDTDKSKVKILDFGFACKMHAERKQMMGSYYTLDYAAPEILSKEIYSESCDLWSLGVVLYALLCGTMPFRRENDKNDDVIMDRIKNAKINVHNSRWRSLAPTAKRLIKMLLKVVPGERIKLSEVLTHEWMNPPKKLRQKVNPKPKKRNTTSKPESSPSKKAKRSEQPTKSHKISRKNSKKMCPVCKKVYILQSALNRHMDAAHNEE